LILEDWFLEELIPRFNDRILAIDHEIVLAWGRLSGKSKQQGIIIPVVDGLIAATAIVHDLTVVTENIHDFIETGARVFNPWLD
jgi:predicted nucleic acid-binding protein